MLGNFSCFYCHLLTFFQINFFKKIFQEHYQNWVQIRTDIMSVLIWVQTVCKGYQQTTKVATNRKRVSLTYGTVYLSLTYHTIYLSLTHCTVYLSLTYGTVYLSLTYRTVYLSLTYGTVYLSLTYHTIYLSLTHCTVYLSLT